ncbi:hypothetical protein KKG31_04840 [Patescibacteria group bacterium]|nr:hypothetical protein [Patescibacteria group bacterium]
MEQVHKEITIGSTIIETTMEMTQERINNRETFKAQLSNGTNAEIKVMPETASNTAITRLQSRVCTEEEGCQIQLKEVGQQEQVRAAYQVETKKEVKLFGLFKVQMAIRSQIDAENGEVIRERKPRWSFLASFANNNEE